MEVYFLFDCPKGKIDSFLIGKSGSKLSKEFFNGITENGCYFEIKSNAIKFKKAFDKFNNRKRGETKIVKCSVKIIK